MLRGVSAGEVVLGVDIGTTSTKAVAYDAGRPRRATARPATRSTSRPRRRRQDPEAVLEAAVRPGACRGRRHDGRAVAALSFSSAMHACRRWTPRRPADPLLTWADSRAADRPTAARRERPGAAPADRHADAPDGAADQADLVPRAASRTFAAVALGRHQGVRAARSPARWSSTTRCASGTGLLDLAALAGTPRRWRIAGIGADQLRRLVPTAGARAEPGGGRATGLAAGPRSSPGAATGRWPTSVSARCTPASRPARSAPAARCGSRSSGRGRPAGGVFCYALTDSGGWSAARSTTAASCCDWAGDALAPDLGDEPARRSLDSPPPCRRAPAG